MIATPEMYKEFTDGAIWQDLLEFCKDCLEVNRDLLEGIKGWKEGHKPEPDDALRGRNWQIRDFIAYVNERAKGD